MKKLILIFPLLLLITNSYGITVNTVPALDMGTAIYVTDNSGVATVGVDDYTTGVIVTTNGGPLGNLSGSAETSLTFVDMNPQVKNVYIEVYGATSGTVTGSCGTISVTGIAVGAYGATSKTYKASTATLLSGLANGLFLPMTASFSGTPTESCTISGPIQGVQIRYANARNKNQIVWQYTNINASLNLILPNYVEHDNGAKLDFGTFCQSTQTQTLTVTPQGTVGSSNVACHNGSVSADSFTFHSAASSLPFSVNLPSGTINISNGTDNLTINNFTSSCGNSCSTSGGSATFTVGATITVP